MNKKAIERLTIAIITQAVTDWKYQKYKAEVERFIKSGWFVCLTNLSPEKLLAALESGSVRKRKYYNPSGERKGEM